MVKRTSSLALTDPDKMAALDPVDADDACGRLDARPKRKVVGVAVEVLDVFGERNVVALGEREAEVAERGELSVEVGRPASAASSRELAISVEASYLEETSSAFSYAR